MGLPLAQPVSVPVLLLLERQALLLWSQTFGETNTHCENSKVVWPMQCQPQRTRGRNILKPAQHTRLIAI